MDDTDPTHYQVVCSDHAELRAFNFGRRLLTRIRLSGVLLLLAPGMLSGLIVCFSSGFIDTLWVIRVDRRSIICKYNLSSGEQSTIGTRITALL